MTTVFLGALSHAPGITGRADRADPVVRDEFYANLDRMRRAIEASRAEALIVIAAEHFANFFMDNMPAYCMGLADHYEGPIEDPEWLGIERRTVPGHRGLSERLIPQIMHRIDLAYAEEWKFDHGVMVPLHFLTPRYDLPIIPVNINCQGPPLTPLQRAHDFGETLRDACDRVPERIAIVATGGISHWPATPDSGKINEDWDREFLDRLVRNEKKALLSYSDEDTYRDGGQGGFEIRTFISLAGAAKQAGGELWFYAPIPIFAVGCTVAKMNIE